MLIFPLVCFYGEKQNGGSNSWAGQIWYKLSECWWKFRKISSCHLSQISDRLTCLEKWCKHPFRRVLTLEEVTVLDVFGFLHVCTNSVNVSRQSNSSISCLQLNLCEDESTHTANTIIINVYVKKRSPLWRNQYLLKNIKM